MFKGGDPIPYKSMVPCKHPGCPELVPAGEKYCEKHKAMHPEEVRSAAGRGYDNKWRAFRKRYLAVHPLCAECLKHGRFTKATVIDHIKPFRGDERLQYDPDNLQPLCKACHDRKTGKYDSHPEYRY